LHLSPPEWVELRDQLRRWRWAKRGAQVGDQLWDQLLGNWYYGFGGACEGGWVAFYDFPLRHLGCAYDALIVQRLAWYGELCTAAFWWWPFPAFTVVSDRPETRWNERGRLHNTEGPAIAFSDGYALDALYGERVPDALTKT